MAIKHSSQSDRIFGYEWSEIQARQMKAYRAPTVDVSAPLPVANADDRSMLAEYGSIEALEAAGMFGVADRLKRTK